MSNLENALQIGGYLSGISKQKYLDMTKLAANGAALAAISSRTSGMTAGYFDLFNGITTYSAGILDTTKTIATSPLTAGDTNIISKVDVSTALTKWFQTGQEISIQDDVSKEYVTVTNGGVSESSVTHDRSTPTTVVATADTTMASARPQILSNGWLIVFVINTSDAKAHWKVSKDNGQTWSELAVTSGGNYQYLSIVSHGTMLYSLGTMSGGTATYFWLFDATTVASTVPASNVPDTGQSSFGTGCSLAINPTGTELHATFSSKNSSYPNSFNIRYVKGTISAVDGSVTWGSVVQVTTLNTTGHTITSPSIRLRDDVPYILFIYNANNSGYFIGVATTFYNNVTYHDLSTGDANWGNKVVYNGGPYAQSSPDIITDQSGILWVTWYGKDAVDGVAGNIRCAKSTDGGNTWTKADGTTGHDKLTSGNTYQQFWPSITYDDSGSIYILWVGSDATNGNYNVRRIIYSGSSWGIVVKLTTNTTSSNQYPSTCSNYHNFTDPICIYQDNQTSSVKFRGIFTQTTLTPHLEVTPLQHSYKTNVLIYRSLGNVDTVNGRLGFSEGFEGITTYDFSTPLTAVNSSYTTSANGRPCRLSNGNIVAIENNNGTIRLQLWETSTQIFRALCFISGATSGCKPSMVSFNNIIYVVFNTATIAYSVAIDTTTVANVDKNSSKVAIDTVTSFSEGLTLTIDSLGYLYFANSSKVPAYSSSFNIRYLKSADGGVTWSAVTQITTYNDSGILCTNPCIVVKQDGNVTIVWQRGGTTKSIHSTSINNNVVQANKDVYLGTSYSQSNPCAVVDNVGVIHVVWDGYDVTDSSQHNIRYSKSTDGGVTWSGMIKITTGNTTTGSVNPSISVDTNNVIYVMYNMYNASSYVNIYRIIYTSSWGSPMALTSFSNGSTPNVSMCSNYQNFTDPLCIYTDYQTGAVKFRGVWTDSSTIGLLEESVVYNITPATSSGQIASWLTYSNSSDFTIDSKFSIINSGNETYLTPTKKTTVIDVDTKEDQYIISAPVGSQIAQRIVMTRANIGVTTKYVTKLLGALG